MKYANKFLLLVAMLITMASPAFCDTADDYINYINRGNAKKSKGDSDGAIADYTKAIEPKPDYALACINRGVAKKRKAIRTAPQPTTTRPLN